MTETTVQRTDQESQDEQGQSFPEDAGMDPILRLLVNAANAHDGRVEEGGNVTLFVNGMMVSGELIPYRQWCEEQAESSDHPEGGLMGVVAKLIWQSDEERESEEATLPPPAEHIHLRNARFLVGNTFSPPLYWRGRLSHVSGWCLGRLGPRDE